MPFFNAFSNVHNDGRQIVLKLAFVKVKTTVWKMFRCQCQFNCNLSINNEHSHNNIHSPHRIGLFAHFVVKNFQVHDPRLWHNTQPFFVHFARLHLAHLTIAQIHQTLILEIHLQQHPHTWRVWIRRFNGQRQMHLPNHMVILFGNNILASIANNLWPNFTFEQLFP